MDDVSQPHGLLNAANAIFDCLCGCCSARQVPSAAPQGALCAAALLLAKLTAHAAVECSPRDPTHKDCTHFPCRLLHTVPNSLRHCCCRLCDPTHKDCAHYTAAALLHTDAYMDFHVGCMWIYLLWVQHGPMAHALQVPPAAPQGPLCGAAAALPGHAEQAAAAAPVAPPSGAARAVAAACREGTLGGGAEFCALAY